MRSSHVFPFFVVEQKSLQSPATEDDIDVELGGMVEGITMIDGLRPVPGGPFSTLTPSMWPQEILAKLGQPEVSPGFRCQVHVNVLF